MKASGAVVLIAFCLFATAGYAQRVRFIETDATSQKRAIGIRAAFAITGPPHHWYTVYFHLAFSRTKYLKKGKHLMVHKWGSIFTPDNIATARWTDIRDSFGYKELAKASNLPRGVRSRVYAVFNVWDNHARKYVGNGWTKRRELFITTDRAGQVTKVEIPAVKSPFTAKNLEGRWKMSFPQGKTSGLCTFTKDGKWSWRILEGGNRRKARDASGSFKLNNVVLELTELGRKQRNHPILWHGEKRFTIKIKDRSVHFTKSK